jgi:L-threonylcarbamoyladenylate synthase
VQLGGIIAYPTEAVFGLGCDPLNRNAVYRLLALKGRDAAKGLILISDSFEHLQPFLDGLKPQILALTKQSWPGPVTLIMPASKNAPDWIRGRHDSVAVRVTDHPIAAAICKAAEMPLVSTSANLSRRIPAKTPLQVRIRCSTKIDYIVHGSTGGLSRPSKIIDAVSGSVLRP